MVFGMYAATPAYTTTATSGDYYVGGSAEDLEVLTSEPGPPMNKKERAGNRSGAAESYYPRRRSACGKGPHQHPEGLGEHIASLR